MKKIPDHPDFPKTYFIKTFGCQANKADSEKIAGYYERKGCKRVEDINEAEVVVINTCSVRQSAENRVGGLINNLTKSFPKNPDDPKLPKIVLAGCMLRYPITDLKKRFPRVDEFLRMEEIGFNLPAQRADKSHAWVPIMEGCNNFCSYCVVPYARGREKSRPMEEIICEVEELVKRRYKEITLLGQNVNSYSPKTPKNPKIPKNSSFSVLLYRLNRIEGLEKIKFMTSNPWDLTDDIIQSIKLPKVEKYLHLPVQSGDDKILRKMNRHYTAKQYLGLINQIRKEIPQIEIGTDIIVGFPGETEEQFQNTVDLCKKAKFSIAYISEYSPRPGTVAHKMKDDVSHKEKQKRWRILNNLINKN